jgi:hypothetical protein
MVEPREVNVLGGEDQLERVDVTLGGTAHRPEVNDASPGTDARAGTGT